MKSRFQNLCLSVAVPFLTTVLFSVTTWADGVVVGVILPMSGTHAALGHMQKNSMLLAVEEVNSRGGIGGEPLQLDVRDSGGQSRNARAVVDHFVKDKHYPVVLGGLNSSEAAALADKCEQRQIPLLILSGSDDTITLQSYRYVFRVAPPRSRYPAAALDFARSRFKGARIMIVTERSDYGDTVARTVKQTVRDAGWAVSGEWKFDPGSRNLEALFSRAAAADPEVIFLAAFPPDGSRIITGLREKIPKATIFNLAPASTVSNSYAQCGNACEGVMNPSLWVPDLVGSGQKYVDRYRARFGTEPDYHGVQAYAAVIAAAQAVKRSGLAQAQPVRDALEAIAVNTPYGKVSFRQWGGFVNQNDPGNYLVQWTGSGFEILWPREFKTAEPVLPEGR